MKLRAFTLIELLITITIISILLAAITISYQNAQKKTRDTKRKNDIVAIASALELYFEQNGTYPDLPSAIDVQSTNALQWENQSGGSIAGGLVGGGFIKDLPVDPINVAGTDLDTNFQYSYIAYVLPSTQEHQYTILANLENNKDPDRNFSVVVPHIPATWINLYDYSYSPGNLFQVN